jgi:hypothetical protein
MPFLIIYLWIGAAHRRWTSVATLPLAGAAFVVPLLLTGDVVDN